MGAKFAPSFANLYMESWELNYLYSDQKPYGKMLSYRNAILMTVLFYGAALKRYSIIVLQILTFNLKFTPESNE